MVAIEADDRERRDLVPAPSLSSEQVCHLVPWGGHNSAPQTGALKHQGSDLSLFWKLDVQLLVVLAIPGAPISASTATRPYFSV